jgi:hypothetical protein
MLKIGKKRKIFVKTKKNYVFFGNFLICSTKKKTFKNPETVYHTFERGQKWIIKRTH